MQLERHFAFLASLFCLITSNTYADTVGVAVASNFHAPMKQLVAQFEEKSGVRLRTSFASSGKLYAQIRQGAPFDVFLSADQHKPQALIERGLADPKSLFTYAIGQLVLWSADADVQVKDAAILLSGSYHKLALANPKIAPYGVAAQEVLNSLGLLEASKKSWVMGENIGQTFQFVGTGNATVGFVAKSQLLQRDWGGAAWPVPADMHQPIRQDAVLLKRAADSANAQAFLVYLASAEAQAIISQFGYRMPNRGSS